MEQSLQSMQDSRESQAKQKLENLFALFHHVECDAVRDIFEAMGQNIQQAAETLKAIYGDAPEDPSEQFKEIEQVADQADDQELVQNPEVYISDDNFEVLPDNTSAEENKEDF